MFIHVAANGIISFTFMVEYTVCMFHIFWSKHFLEYTTWLTLKEQKLWVNLSFLEMENFSANVHISFTSI